jgi:hypothetical protein
MSCGLSSLEILKMRRSKSCLTIGGLLPRITPRCRTHTEAEEVVAEASDFLALVESWIAANHPRLTP